MDLENLFKLQKELDERILKEHNLEVTSLRAQQVLGLQVGIGELANKTRCFKYWSDKKSSPKEVLLEEYINCFHLILSLGIYLNFQDIKPNILENGENLTDQFLGIYIDISDFMICSSRDNYLTLFEDFSALGTSLGFTENEIELAYYRKNDINIKRQASGY